MAYEDTTDIYRLYIYMLNLQLVSGGARLEQSRPHSLTKCQFCSALSVHTVCHASTVCVSCAHTIVCLIVVVSQLVTGDCMTMPVKLARLETLSQYMIQERKATLSLSAIDRSQTGGLLKRKQYVYWLQLHLQTKLVGFGWKHLFFILIQVGFKVIYRGKSKQQFRSCVRVEVDVLGCPS